MQSLRIIEPRDLPWTYSSLPTEKRHCFARTYDRRYSSSEVFCKILSHNGRPIPRARCFAVILLPVHADPPLGDTVRLHTGVSLGSKVAKCDNLKCRTVPNQSNLSMASVPIYRTIVR